MIQKVTDEHELIETIHIDIDVPGHAPRSETPLYKKTRKELLERDGGKCWICGRTGEESGFPLEAHHHPIERMYAEHPDMDWDAFRQDCMDGVWGPHAQKFDWSTFSVSDPYKFVDDMTVNGKLLCKDHHTHTDSGIHMLPFPNYIIQRYLKEGGDFSPQEKIKRD